MVGIFGTVFVKMAGEFDNANLPAWPRNINSHSEFMDKEKRRQFANTNKLGYKCGQASAIAPRML